MGLLEIALRGRGVDTEFLYWLEGDGQWLPLARRVDLKDLLEAFRAVFWLQQHAGQSALVAPDTIDEWDARYTLLRNFLWGHLQQSWVSWAPHKRGQISARGMAKDLQSLETVLERTL